MKPLSPSAERICVIAITHFAERGYDASSLNDIAVAAGMRKPSLYAHFASKDALFDAAWSMALASEQIYVESCFSEMADDETAGKRYTQLLCQRYQESPSLRFLLRTAFFPPVELRPIVSVGFEAYLERMSELFSASLVKSYPLLPGTEVAMFKDAYIAVIDSLHVELIYGNPQVFERRLSALWRMLGDSLKLATGEVGHG
ncbi:TetR/AcrR family transcriptional regulator [Pseudomonas helleri]|uniref:TetR/AcrR family transcriptional regulator n=1 Tax=Pseudomonas helleri TaxID=1608996 RepID=UPI003F9D606F